MKKTPKPMPAYSVIGAGHQLALGLGHVEGGAVGLGQHADEEDEEGDRHQSGFTQTRKMFQCQNAAGLLA